MDTRSVLKAFKFRRLTVRAEAQKALTSVLAREVDPKDALETIIGEVQAYLERHGKPSIVDLECITHVVANLSRNEEDIARQSIDVISAFKVPHLQYKISSKTFVMMPAAGKSLHAPAESKIAMYRERFLLLQQRILRNPLFAPSMLGTGAGAGAGTGAGAGAAAGARAAETLVLTPVSSVSSMEGTMYVLGMLVQPEEDKLCLEDLRDRIALDVTGAITTPGMFTETCMVLAQGKYRASDHTLVVDMMGFPPPEKRVDSLLAMGRVDPLDVLQSPAEFTKVLELQVKATDAMYVVASDVHLDVPEVMDNLRRMFKGFASAGVVPSMFVFIGNFSSHPFGLGSADRAAYQANFQALADLISTFPTLHDGSHFTFVPGLTDPGASGVLPRPPLPKSFTRALSSLPCVSFTTNPCRIRHYTQEIVVFRGDSFSRMRRHALLPPTTASDLPPHAQLVQTVLDQAHLCPVPPTLQPVYWDYDHAMRLYPLPDVLILADDCDEYHWTYEGCAVFNPGSFPRETGFSVYHPATQDTEVSRISDLDP